MNVSRLLRVKGRSIPLLSLPGLYHQVVLAEEEVLLHVDDGLGREVPGQPLEQPQRHLDHLALLRKVLGVATCTKETKVMQCSVRTWSPPSLYVLYC